MSLAALTDEHAPHRPARFVEPPIAAPWKRSTIACVVLVAFVLRIAFLLILKTYLPGRVDDDCIAGETTNIAMSIARGHGFSSAYNGDPTGPTAAMPPAYPYFVALVFRFLGPLTTASIIFIFAAQSLCSALTVIPILGIARYSVGRRAGMWAAWSWAVFPWFSKWSVTWLWDTSASALLLALLCWYAFTLRDAPSRKWWVGFGLLWGVALLVNPSLGGFLPISLSWCAYELYRCQNTWLKPVVLSSLACLIVISPWLVRNRVVFGQWVFIRSNFGLEFATGNFHTSNGRGWGLDYPSGNQKEFQKYWQMGEMAYFKSREKKALQFVSAYPGEFLELTAKRVPYFWDGSAMGYKRPIPWYWAPSSFAPLSFLLLPALLIAHRRRIHGWYMFFGLLLLYPIPYYLTFSQVRYRHAIEPVMVLLIAYAGVESARYLRAQRSC